MEFPGDRGMGWGFPWESSVGPELGEVEGCLFGIGGGRAGFSGWAHPCLRMVPNHSNWCRAVLLRWVAMRPLSSAANLPDVAMTRSSGVTLGSVMYLCLWKTVVEILVNIVSFIRIVHVR